RAAAGGAVKRTTAAEPRRFTGRATILLGVLIALALAYTYPIRVYLSQQSEIARREAALAEQRKKIGELSEKARLWDDPEYIKAQARKRFYMVYPDQVPLVVLDDPQAAPANPGQPAGGTPNQPADPWYDTLWSSIRAADGEGHRQ
ncbi:septum formation initiator family protein, partial [Micromonospora zhanjiangensis]